MTTALVLDEHADIYTRALQEEFPELRIVVAKHAAMLSGELSHIDVLIAFGIAVDDVLMSRLRGLAWIQSLATGVDHFLRCPALEPEVIITSMRGIHGAPMRETAVYLMMAVSRGAARHVHGKDERVWDRGFYSMLSGKTAVVAGVGVAGTAIAELLKALGMIVIGVSRKAREIAAFDRWLTPDRLPEAAAMADYLINVLPADAHNELVFNATVFEVMRPSAYFINVGRGQTVDEAALIAALRERRIAGAGLDVYQTEPLPSESPFWDLPNVYLSPHEAGHIIEYEQLATPIILHNMRLFLAGRPADMRNIVER